MTLINHLGEKDIFLLPDDKIEWHVRGFMQRAKYTLGYSRVLSLLKLERARHRQRDGQVVDSISTPVFFLRDSD